MPLHALRALTDPDVERLAVLEAVLWEMGVEATRIVLAGSLHLVVRFGDSAYDSQYRTKLLVAHHDRAAGSPGALDNGAACLQLAALAGRLSMQTPQRVEPHNTVIRFTDSEEAVAAGDQGSFSVARALAGRVRSLAGEGEEPPAVFVFDVTGRGNAPVISMTAQSLLDSRQMGDTDLAEDIRSLSSWAGRALRKGTGRSPLSLPIPWSDELGFALGGIPAVTITLLPHAEMDAYRNALNSAALGKYPESMPPTWARLHGPEDDISQLEESSFELMSRILDAFAELKIPRVRRIQ